MTITITRKDWAAHRDPSLLPITITLR